MPFSTVPRNAVMIIWSTRTEITTATLVSMSGQESASRRAARSRSKRHASGER